MTADRPISDRSLTYRSFASRLPFRAEDVALVVSNLVAVPLLSALGGGFGGGGSSTDGAGAAGNAPLFGLIEVVAVVGVIVALATRVPGTPPLTTEGFHAWALAGPLIGGVGLVGGDASERLGMDLAVLGLVAFVAVFAAFVLADRLPVLPEVYRRLAVTPFILVTGGFFTDFIADLLDGVDPIGMVRELLRGTASPENASIGSLVLLFVLAGSAVFYAMLILAPRELAAPEPKARVWIVRYLVFLASAVIGAGGSFAF